MKRGIRTEIDWGLIGAELAQASDDEQSECFKAFVSEMSSFETQWQGNVQFAAIRAKLTSEEKETLSQLGDD